MDRNHEDAEYLVDWSAGYTTVQTNPEKLSGTPTLRDTRMPAQFIIENYMAGYTPDEVAELFGLSKVDVRALIAEAVAKNPVLLKH